VFTPDRKARRYAFGVGTLANFFAG
jgi:hypothetical protein